MQTGVTETLDEKAFFAIINQIATLSLRTYGMTVDIFKVFLTGLTWSSIAATKNVSNIYIKEV